MIDQGEFVIPDIVVNRFGNPHRDQVKAAGTGHLADGKGSVLRVIAPDVKEIADPMGTKDVHDAFEILLLFFFQFVPAGTDASGCGGGPKKGDLLIVLVREVQQFFLQHPFNAMPSAKDSSERIREHFAGFDYAPEGIVDDRRRAA